MEKVKALKKFGQNFLKNKMVLENISSLVNVSEDDLIIEIGPGMGALTEYLVKKNSHLLCYEIDERMKEHLNKYESEKVKVIYGDFLGRNIESDVNEIIYKNLYVVANIPYYITSPILSKLINVKVEFKKIVLLVQKEFAERITADYGCKDYNALTLFVDYKYLANLEFIVPRVDFTPVPNVDSAVISLSYKNTLDIINEEGYFKFIKDAFMNKRKTLRNNLKNYDWNKIVSILKDLGYEENVRAEEISKENFKIIWEKLSK